jgi:hypothetical protein
MGHNFAHTFEFGRDETGMEPMRDPTRTNIRQTTYFAAWVDFIPNAWFVAEIGYSMGRNILNANGTYGNPIWSPNEDMRLYVQAIFTLDKLYQAVFTRGSGQGGVIRTRNEPQRNPFAASRF